MLTLDNLKAAFNEYREALHIRPDYRDACRNLSLVEARLRAGPAGAISPQ